MNSATKQRLFTFARDFMKEKAETLPAWEIADLKRAYPFYPLFLTDEELLGFKKERSLTTKFGTGFYPTLARIIAEDKYKQVFMGHKVSGTLNSGAYDLLEEIINGLRHKDRRPDHLQEIADILASKGGGVSERVAVCDLFIGDFHNGPLCIELKGPTPNLSTASDAKRNMLYFLAVMNRQGHANAMAYLGLYYNPKITRAAYDHWATKQIMDLKIEVLMGAELWDMIGGEGTFETMLPVLEKARLEVFGK